MTSAIWRAAVRHGAPVAAALLALAPAARAQDASVRGVVRGADGRLVPLVEVLVNDSARTRTDSTGAFFIGRLPARQIELTLRRVGFAPLSLPITLAAGQRRTLAIELAPLPFSLSATVIYGSRPGLYGQVVDLSGKPVEGATIMVAGSGRRVTSAEDGSFAMPELRGQAYAIHVRRPGYYAGRFFIAIPADRGQQLRVELEPIADGVSGTARRVAEGVYPQDTVLLGELDHRLRVNSTIVIPQAVLAKEGPRALSDILEKDLHRLIPLGAGTRGVTSMGAAGKTDATASDRGPATQALSQLAAAQSSVMRAAQLGPICYFVNGEFDLDVTFTLNMPAEWIESIEMVRQDVTGTLRQRMPPDTKTTNCKLFVVVWTRGG